MKKETNMSHIMWRFQNQNTCFGHPSVAWPCTLSNTSKAIKVWMIYSRENQRRFGKQSREVSVRITLPTSDILGHAKSAASLPNVTGNVGFKTISIAQYHSDQI